MSGLGRQCLLLGSLVWFPAPQGLAEAGYEIVSTGGSAKAIEAAGVPVKSVDQLTGFPEMLDGTPLPLVVHPCPAALGEMPVLAQLRHPLENRYIDEPS